MSDFSIARVRPCKKGSEGVTLVELMIAIALLGAALGTLYMLARATFVNTEFHDAEIVSQNEAQRGLQFMVTELRPALRGSFTGPALPRDQVTFRIPGDADGNGVPVDVGGYIESTGTITYMRDAQDLNGDGITTTQLVRVARDNGGAITGVTVIANNIMANEDVNGDGVLNPGEDLNASRTLERGMWFQWVGPLIRATVDTEQRLSNGNTVWATMTAQVSPRN